MAHSKYEDLKERSNKEKKEIEKRFLSEMSHKLRNPKECQKESPRESQKEY